ncbi:hypothetical protein [Sulfurospirillum arcachonense]|uniref:hypothetical protein n=1 Tax=Sulfurospirillum arcachonense TaxID=57666 RepID=UPI00046AA36B|nr:hypothetical protein [Sulfurospirillum arcachonense]
MEKKQSNSLLRIFIMLSILLSGACAYLMLNSTQKPNQHKLVIPTIKKDIIAIAQYNDDFITLYTMMQTQYKEYFNELESITTLSILANQLKFVTEKSYDNRKRERLTSEIRQWMSIKRPSYVYIKALNEQLDIQLNRLNQKYSKENIQDIQTTIEDIIFKLINRSLVQSKIYSDNAQSAMQNINQVEKEINKLKSLTINLK